VRTAASPTHRGRPGIVGGSLDVTSIRVQRHTRRERQILSLIAEGLSNQVIADRLTLSVATVEAHERTILRKLDATSTLEAAAIAARHGLLAP
jgi:DNA-binding NarL/FixJ family response regulator